MKLPTLLKVMKYTTGMRLLQPDNEELALMASIGKLTFFLTFCLLTGT